VFFSYVHRKIAQHTPAAAKDNLQMTKCNTATLYIKKEDINKFTEETEALLKKYMTSDGDSYQLTTFLVPDTKGEK